MSLRQNILSGEATVFDLSQVRYHEKSTLRVPDDVECVSRIFSMHSTNGHEALVYYTMDGPDVVEHIRIAFNGKLVAFSTMTVIDRFGVYPAVLNSVRAVLTGEKVPGAHVLHNN